jgi:beta-galactosidase
VTVEVYADADEVELLVNGEPVGRSKVGDELGCLASFETTYEPGEITAVAYRAGAECGRWSLTSATGLAKLRVSVDRGRIDATERDLAYVAIALVDDAGTVHTGDDRPVTVTVDGPAVLQGFGSGNPCTEETFGSETHDTFLGRALAVVRPTGPGTITVVVSAKDCDDRTVTIEATTP